MHALARQVLDLSGGRDRICAGGYYAFVKAPPIYRADSVVMLESRKEQVMDIESVVSGLGGDQITINTEVEVRRAG